MMHGGLSTGAKTVEGQLRISNSPRRKAAVQRYFVRMRLLRDQGFIDKLPGRPPGKKRVLSMAEAAKGRIETVLVELPAPVDKPVEQMTLAELSVETNRAGLIACLDMCRRYDPDMDIKERRLIADIAGMTTRANLRVAESGFRQQQHDDTLDKLLAAIEAEKAEP